MMLRFLSISVVASGDQSCPVGSDVCTAGRGLSSPLQQLSTDECPDGDRLACGLAKVYSKIYIRERAVEPWEREAVEETLPREGAARMPTRPMQRARFQSTDTRLLSSLFEGMDILEGDSLVDLGAGAGHACLAAFLGGPWQSVVGIELSQDRWKLGSKALSNAAALINGAAVQELSNEDSAFPTAILTAGGSRLHWIQGDFTTESAFKVWAPHTAIMLDSLLFTDAAFDSVIASFTELPAGTVVASARPLPGCGPHLVPLTPPSAELSMASTLKEWSVYVVNMRFPSFAAWSHQAQLFAEDEKDTARQLFQSLGSTRQKRLSLGVTALSDPSDEKAVTLMHFARHGFYGSSLQCLFSDLYSDEGFGSGNQDLGSAGTYGEITADGLAAIMDHVDLDAPDIFWDLGAGVGKACVQAFLGKWSVRSSIAVEFALSRHQSGSDALRRLQRRTGGLLESADGYTVWNPPDSNRELAMVYGDILEMDLRNATVLYVANLLFPESVKFMVNQRLSELPAGTVFALLFQPQGCYRNAALVAELQLPMTWAENQMVYLYMSTALPSLRSFVGITPALRASTFLNDTAAPRGLEAFAAHVRDLGGARGIRFERFAGEVQTGDGETGGLSSMAEMLLQGLRGTEEAPLACLLSNVYPYHVPSSASPAGEEALLGEFGSGLPSNAVAVAHLLGSSHVAVRQGDVIFDLGGGSGALAFGLFVASEACRVLAIEKSPTRYSSGRASLESAGLREASALGEGTAEVEMDEMSLKLRLGGRTLEWVNGDFDTDLSSLSSRSSSECPGARFVALWFTGKGSKVSSAAMTRTSGGIANSLPAGSILVTTREVTVSGLRLVAETDAFLSCARCARSDDVWIYEVQH